MTDSTKKQGETFKLTLAFKDSAGYPIKIAEDTSTPLKYFMGIADNGTTEESFSFKYGPTETKTSGEGLGEITDTGIYSVICYLPADTTALMAAGSWEYVIRMSDTINPADTDNVIAVAEGTLTLEASLNTITDSTVYTAPSA